MGRVWFVSGIDTGIGKTIATGLAARYLVKAGVKAITVKMAQTGNVGFSEDLEKHREFMGIGRLPGDDEGLTAPQIFAFPASPLLAARREHRVVEVNKIVEAVNRLRDMYDEVLVEGAGGLAVPLTENLLTIDLAAREKWPLLLVSCGRLGSLSQTLLSIEAAIHHGLVLKGIIYNYFEGADPEIDLDTPEMTLKYLAAHGLAAPLVRVPEVGATIPEVDFSPIFGGGQK
ncbi:MAG: dethiobiotin synthase [Victivallaceae bacterium]|nr:dethiobiotin synthase [Victivallaceae bacterium]